MGDWHQIDITAGPYAWHVEPDDEGQLGDVLAGLKVATNYTEDHPIQGTTGPWSASFGIVVADVSELSDLAIGSPCTIMAWADTPGAIMTDLTFPYDEQVRLPLVQFIGEISELSAQPDSQGRMVVTVMATDPLATLANFTAGTTDYPKESLRDRFVRVWNVTGLPLPGAEGEVLYGEVEARPASPINVLEYLQQLLSWQVSPPFEGSSGVALMLTPNPALVETGDPAAPLLFGDYLDPVTPFTFQYVWKETIHGNALIPRSLPFHLADGPAGWNVEIDPHLAGDQLHDGGLVELDTTFSKTKANKVDRSIVTLTDWVWDATRPDPVPVEFRVETELVLATSLGSAENVVVFNLPDRGIDAWGIDKLTILDAPSTTVIPWFCLYNQAAGNLREPIVISNVRREWNPAGKPWISGILRNAAITFGQDGWEIELELRPELPRAYNRYGPSGYNFSVENPGAEVNTTGWVVAGTAATLTRDTTQAQAGVASFKLTTTALTPVGTGQASVVPVEVAGSNQNYQLSLWVRGTGTALVSLRHGPAGVEFAALAPVALTGAWQKLTLDAVTPVEYPDLTSVYPVIRQGTAGAQSLWFDTVAVESAPREPYLSPRNMKLDPTLAAITVADLDPDLTVYDLRLTRRP